MKKKPDRSVRIVGGQRKGKKLRSIPGHATRPLMRRVKQSLFDMIGKKVENSNFLDMYAGMGSVGIEAISRGAKRAVFVDRDPACLKIINTNLSMCRFKDRAEVVQGDIPLWMDKGISFYLRQKYDLIFMGPPFKLNLTGISLEVVCKHGLLGEEGWIICQHHIGEKAPERAGGTSFVLFRQEKYGKTMLSFYRHDK